MKDKLFSKIVKKDYNNNLEEVLSKKSFSEDVKNTLLNIFYKIENGYDDYKTIKKETFEKQDYIEKLINIIEKNCKKIEFIDKPNAQEETVNREQKKIVCFPIETKLLYLIAKSQKRKVVVNYLDESIEEAVSFVLNTGNNINMVEPLRDFNGFSWNIIVKDIEELNCNLIYQNMIFLIGNASIDKWVNNYDPLVDYFELFQSKLEEFYGAEIKEEILNNLIQLSIMINIKYDENFKIEVENKKVLLQEELSNYMNKEEYIVKIANSKKSKEKEIKKIDRIIHDKTLLSKEYDRRNKKLPLEKKIFSVRVLKNELKTERRKILTEIKELNKNMEPEEYFKRKQIIEQKLRYLDFSIKTDLNKGIYNKEIELQKLIIKCMYIKIKKIKEKKELIDLIYEYRYYNHLPITKRRYIYNVKEIKENLDELAKCIINKAIKLKVINKIIDDEEQNVEITKKLILSKIISLEDIHIKPTIDSNNVCFIIFDEEIEDNKINLENITKDKIKIKLNKKNKLFI